MSTLYAEEEISLQNFKRSSKQSDQFDAINNLLDEHSQLVPRSKNKRYANYNLFLVMIQELLWSDNDNIIF